MERPSVAGLVVGDAFVASLVDMHLARDPAAVEAMRRHGVTAVAVDASRLGRGGDVVARIQRALDEAARAPAVAALARPAFVVAVLLGDLIARGVAEGGAWRLAAPLPVRAPRGAFAGVVGLGEGGLAFCAADGSLHLGTSPALAAVAAEAIARAAALP